MTDDLSELYKERAKYQLILDKQIRLNEWKKPMPRGRIISIKGDIDEKIRHKMIFEKI